MPGRREDTAEDEEGVRPYRQESLLIEAISEMPAGRVVCTSAGLAQFAGATAKAFPSSDVVCTYLDLYRANLALDHWVDRPPNLRIQCTADLPQVEVDVVAFPFSAGGEAELTRDLMLAGHQRLRIGGKMYAATDNRKDKWLRDQLAKIFRKLEWRSSRAGTLYIGTKTQALKKERNLACEFAFRDRERLIHAYSRPGVFSHRHVDVGARRLMDAMEVAPGDRILDIGCGAGVVALAAACGAANVTVHAVDSNARAVECTERGAVMNGLTNLTAELNAAGNFLESGNYDLVLANPPYYSGFRIAQHFVTSGCDALRPGGRILVVTKRPDWYQQNMPDWYENVSIAEQKGYYLVHGTRPKR
jgi:16S rRNA (guanine1207-N2)-methyltransferase